jgi:hypothetical protein
MTYRMESCKTYLSAAGATTTGGGWVAVAYRSVPVLWRKSQKTKDASGTMAFHVIDLGVCEAQSMCSAVGLHVPKKTQ